MIERISSLIGLMKPGRFGNSAPDARPVFVAEMYGRRMIQATAWARSAGVVRGPLDGGSTGGGAVAESCVASGKTSTMALP